MATKQASKLMKLTYFDPKAETRLEAYADTVVIEHEGKMSYIAAIRLGATLNLSEGWPKQSTAAVP